MSVQRQIGFWFLAIAFLTLFLFVFREILLPFVAGMAIAYLLDPVADRLEKLGMSRMLATILILLVSVESLTLPTLTCLVAMQPRP